MHLKHWLAASLLGLAAGNAIAQAPPGGGPPPEMRAAMEALRNACAEDIKTTCGGAEGRERMMCLRQNEAKLKPACKQAMDKMPRFGGGPGGGQAGGQGGRPPRN
jgi:hypothetical protein